VTECPPVGESALAGDATCLGTGTHWRKQAAERRKGDLTAEKVVKYKSSWPSILCRPFKSLCQSCIPPGRPARAHGQVVVRGLCLSAASQGREKSLSRRPAQASPKSLNLTSRSPPKPARRDPSPHRPPVEFRRQNPSPISTDDAPPSDALLTPRNRLLRPRRERISQAHGGRRPPAASINPGTKCRSQTARLPGRRPQCLIRTSSGCFRITTTSRRGQTPP